MTVEITRDELIQLIQGVGPHCWWIYSAMVAMAEDGECRVTQGELASQLGVSESSVRRYITRLSRFQIKGQRLVTTAREFDSNVYYLTSLEVVAGSTSPQKAVLERKATATEEVWRYWQEKYLERYGFKYKPANFGKDMGCLKRLVDRYQGDVELIKQIIDVIMRLYDQRWKTKQFTRPTIGQLSSWLAAQAEPFALKGNEQEPEIEVLDGDSEADLFELIERKWGG